MFLPPYSPDMNPIEQAFSKVKGLVRKAGARTRGALDEAIGEALSAVTPEDAAGWFAHCGYQAAGSILVNTAVTGDRHHLPGELSASKTR